MEISCLLFVENVGFSLKEESIKKTRKEKKGGVLGEEKGLNCDSQKKKKKMGILICN